MFVAVRKYRLRRGSTAEWAQRVQTGFVPLMRELDGFRGYYLLDGGQDVVITISMFDSADAALVSMTAEKAADWVRHNVLEVLPWNAGSNGGRRPGRRGQVAGDSVSSGDFTDHPVSYAPSRRTRLHRGIERGELLIPGVELLQLKDAAAVHGRARYKSLIGSRSGAIGEVRTIAQPVGSRNEEDYMDHIALPPRRPWEAPAAPEDVQHGTIAGKHVGL